MCKMLTFSFSNQVSYFIAIKLIFCPDDCFWRLYLSRAILACPISGEYQAGRRLDLIIHVLMGAYLYNWLMIIA